MAITNLVSATTASAVGTTEYSLVNNSTTIATSTTAAAVQLFLDGANMAAGDSFEVALQEKAKSGGTQRRTVIGTLIGAQSGLYITGTFMVLNGWDVTIKKLSGTDRSFDYSIRSP